MNECIGSTVTLTKENFTAEIDCSDEPYLVDFWGDGCGPCKILAPLLEELADEYQGRVRIGKVNVKEQPGLAAAYKVRGLPTLKLFIGGKEAGSIAGMRSKGTLVAFLDAALGVGGNTLNNFLSNCSFAEALLSPGNESVIREQLEENPNLVNKALDVGNDQSMSPMLLVLSRKFSAYRDILLEYQPKLSAQELAGCGLVETLKATLDEDSSLALTEDQFGFSPLGLALRNEQEKCVKLLLEYGAKIDAVSGE